jgi:hypothetical protein
VDTHILPRGFVRIRHFGFLSGTAKKSHPFDQGDITQGTCSEKRAPEAEDI